MKNNDDPSVREEDGNRRSLEICRRERVKLLLTPILAVRTPCLLLQVTRSFDAARIATMACMACVADAVMRLEAADVPSQLCLHYAGRAPGPTLPYGIEVGYFLEESGFLEFHDPFLARHQSQLCP